MSKFRLEIVTPEKSFFDDDVETLVIRTPEGDVGILKNHEQAVFAISPGVIKLLIDGQWREAAVSSGFAEVTKEKTSVLLSTAEWPEEIDVARANAAKERAELRLKNKTSEVEYIRSKISLAKALARLKVTKNK